MSSSGYGLAVPFGSLPTTPFDRVLGVLTAHASRWSWASTEAKQVEAWRETWEWLNAALPTVLALHPEAEGWTVCLEYSIPRRSGRIDVVLLAGSLVLVLEFKKTQADAAALRQAEDYALELLDFHAESQACALFPIVCAGQATKTLGNLETSWGVASITTCPPAALGEVLNELYKAHHNKATPPIDPIAWLGAPYQPTPTILEAARSLYAGHEVRELSQSHASSEQLHRTFEAVRHAVSQAGQGKKTICFLTGVPGAGKTLAGLNVVHQLAQGSRAAFLSGNGPLVSVLQKVLAKDLGRRTGISASEAKRQASVLVTNVHRWLEEYVDRKPDAIPPEQIVVFDEAQRAWNREHSKRKFGRDRSEPHMMLEALNRHPDGAVLVALVGGGQEINTGEAGLAEWGRTLASDFSSWDISVSPELLQGNSSVAGSTLFPDPGLLHGLQVRTDPDLHLQVTQRAFRAQLLTEWVEQVLACSPQDASQTMERIRDYPIVMTRSLDRARLWLRERTRGLRRCGLLASSGARRLRPHGITVREKVDEANWFLAPPEDVRSSNFLELALTEFGVQGLEVDWAGLAWGGDLTRSTEGWRIRSFKGTRWTRVGNPIEGDYVLNRYRVLLTRAREGLVIWIPGGDPDDKTRDPRLYNGVFDYLSECGIRSI